MNLTATLQAMTAHSTETDTDAAVDACLAQIHLAPDAPVDWLLLSYTPTHDARAIARRLAERLPDGGYAGGSSCLGVMTREGFHSEADTAMGVFALRDPGGDFGVGAARQGDDPRRAARDALAAALADADRPGETPTLIWITAAPGHEEELIAGIAELVGPDVPVAGGSTGDNDVSGHWTQVAGDAVYEDAVVISALFTSVEIAYAFHSGYDPTETSGTVTRAEGRILLEIDGRPAAEVYDEWTGGTVADRLSEGGNVLSSTTLFPLGREVGRVGDFPYFRLAHPDSVTPERGLTLFSDIAVGDRLILMRGSRESLVTRAGRVTQSAIETREFTPEDIRGALVIYCAGCMLTVRESMPDVAAEVRAALGEAPFMGTFTFGEQGCFIGQENSHGNLMISVVVFSDRPAF